MKNTAQDQANATAEAEARDAAFLLAIGGRVRLLRARRGLTRKALAVEAEVSERHLANLESGTGNASVLILRAVADALGSTVAEIVGDDTSQSAEWHLLRDLLHGKSDQEIGRARAAIASLFERRDPTRSSRVALVGLRGAGKSTIGRMLASELDMPFIELSAEIEKLAGCPASEIHGLYGPNAYRRYELRALEAVLALQPRMVLATPGGLVSESGTLNLLLSHCYTVWLKATPEEHMRRVMAQGDLRPMAASREAMEDLKSILAGRADFYAKADMTFDTSGLSLGDAFLKLRAQVVGGVLEPVRHAT